MPNKQLVNMQIVTRDCNLVFTPEEIDKWKSLADSCELPLDAYLSYLLGSVLDTCDFTNPDPTSWQPIPKNPSEPMLAHANNMARAIIAFADVLWENSGDSLDSKTILSLTKIFAESILHDYS